MDRSHVLDLYDDAYAAAYDERFLLAAWPKEGADFEAEVLRALLDDEARWLDVGCGTGYFLSLFPGVERAGLDLSPAMLEQARRANPDALFLREGDFRDDVEEWHHAWSVVSCMWTAYNYVDSMAELEAMVANLVRWTAPDGSCFLPVMDLEDLRYVRLPYEEDPDVWGGTIALTGVTWTWDEPGTDKRHEHLIAPHVGHFVRLLEPHFTRVEVVRYPVLHPGWISRKAVVATGRRPAGETGPAEVVWHPIPRHPDEDLADEGADRGDAADAGGGTEDLAPRVAEVQEGLAALRAEVAALAATVAHALAPPEEVVDLSATSTRRLATEVVSRANPLTAGFWRRAARRVRRR